MDYFDFKYGAAEARVALFDCGRKEAHAYVHPADATASAASQIASLAYAAQCLAAELKVRPVFMRWLLSDPANQQDCLPKEKECAVSVIGQPPLDGAKAALLLILEEGADLAEQSDGVWADSRSRLWAGDNESVETADARTMTEEFLESLSTAIRQNGGTLKDNCLRTWFFVRDIDNNYSGVVKGRNNVFACEGLTSETHFIASTGIEGTRADPKRLVSLNAVADTHIRPEQITYLCGSSHLNPTYEYGVAFERGTAVDYGDRRHVYISGTASIDNKGRIVAPGDIKAQTERMLKNIGVLLEEGDCGWEDIAHMTVYLRDIADYQTVKGIIETRYPDIPKAIVLAPVCRPGWLVETECMAIKERINPEYEPY